MANTYKVYLTAEKWQSLCASDTEVADKVAKQQPELFAQFTFASEEKDSETEKSPVRGMNAAEAIDLISRMTSKDKLEQISEHDQRVSVRNASDKRLEAIENS